MMWNKELVEPFITMLTFRESRFVYFQEDPFAGPVEVEVKDGVYLHFHSLHVMDMEVCCTKAILWILSGALPSTVALGIFLFSTMWTKQCWTVLSLLITFLSICLCWDHSDTLAKIAQELTATIESGKMHLTKGRPTRQKVHPVTTNLFLRRILSSGDSLSYLTINVNTIN